MNQRIKLAARQAMLGRKKHLNLLTLATAAVFVLSVAGTFTNAFLRNNVFIVASVSGAVIYILKSVISYKTQLETLSLARNMPRISIKKREYLRAVCLSVSLSALKFFEIAVFEIFPVSVTGVLYLLLLKGNGISRKVFYVVITGTLLLAVTGLIFWFVSVQKYSRARLLLAAYPEITVADALKLSVAGMNGRLLSAVRFKFSFLPWIVLCIFIFPIIFVVPYYNQSVTCFLLTGDAFWLIVKNYG